MPNIKSDKTEKLPTGYFVKGYDKLNTKVNPEYEKANLEDFEDAENPYEDAEVFLHGSCDLFALALHQKYGYSALNLRVGSYPNTHFFCQSNYKRENVYIDVRGITGNLDDIILEFVRKDDEWKIVPYNFNGERNLSKAEEFGLQFAKRIIEDNPEYYDINKLEI